MESFTNGHIYSHSYDGPTQADYIMKEVHFGSCGSHEGPRSMTQKILCWWYYWPTIVSDTFYFVRKCDKCQRFAPITRQQQSELVTFQSPWPFAQWGLDILGPFPGRVKFLLVAVDYFTKWVEVEPVAHKY